jgi:N-acetylmuramoyl-L-alanine amidase
VAPILGIFIIFSLGSAAIPALAKQPLFEAYRRIIVLDPGHGGHEIGARGADGMTEKTVTLELAQLIAAELMRDYQVKLTRTDDYQVDLDNRTALANHLKADVFVSLHTGGSFVYSTSGFNIFYNQNASESSLNRRQNSARLDENHNKATPWDRIQKSYQERSRILAQIMSSRLGNLNYIKNIRVQGASMVVLQGAQMPAILIEIGYLTNPAEEKSLGNSQVLKDIATVISGGIDDFLSQTDKMSDQ